MNHQLEPKEAYFYGLLVALAKEQKEAIHKQEIGKLNKRGLAKLKTRITEIQKVMLHLFNTKNDLGEQVVPEILKDLSFIETNTEEWYEVTPEEIECLRDVLNEMT